MPANPGSILPGGIVIIDEPESCGLNTFAANGEVLLTFTCRPGGNCGQVIIGLSPNQALQLLQRLQTHADYYNRAVKRGKGGASFPDPMEPKTGDMEPDGTKCGVGPPCNPT